MGLTHEGHVNGPTDTGCLFKGTLFSRQNWQPMIMMWLRASLSNPPRMQLPLDGTCPRPGTDQDRILFHSQLLSGARFRNRFKSCLILESFFECGEDMQLRKAQMKNKKLILSLFLDNSFLSVFLHTKQGCAQKYKHRQVPWVMCLSVPKNSWCVTLAPWKL